MFGYPVQPARRASVPDASRSAGFVGFNVCLGRPLPLLPTLKMLCVTGPVVAVRLLR